ncbi:SDR family NAD(P)-dependent oxidoreductase [Terasakiella sp. SH-1]|uniref:SDR family NAD(P)-dependent oxidoreductase n=1 Tax=Terasakiella sp. SH-1 TaxID=2560057 RepID=UPI001074481A|nr:SDR family NAD(P)-dependent oxidoreductase [Terasakiella sp. SH-1]
MNQFVNVMVFGASGGVGRALLDKILEFPSVERVFAGSRTEVTHPSKKVVSFYFDFDDEEKIKQAIEFAAMEKPLDLIVVATGILSEAYGIAPEKSLKELEWDQLLHYFHVNSVGPMLVAKHAIPLLNRKSTSVFAAMTARVGSISDNSLGGWYGYRASKAALNMMIKCAAIEAARNNEQATVIGLHPGTVDTALSKPFLSHVPEERLFTSDFAAEKLMDVLTSVRANDSGRVLAWDGQEIGA